MTHRAASSGVVLGHVSVGPRNRCGDDVPGLPAAYLAGGTLSTRAFSVRKV